MQVLSPAQEFVSFLRHLDKRSEPCAKGQRKGYKRKSYFSTDSHYISATLSFGCQTNRCHTSAWKASVCGVTVWEFATRIRKHTSAT
jgi:hypothetical protein